VSFGVAPAVLGYTLGLRGLWDSVILTYFVCCGISRLARFNVTAAALTNVVTGKVKYFEGPADSHQHLPGDPAGHPFLAGSTGPAFPRRQPQDSGPRLPSVLAALRVSGSLMISTIKVPKP
jgi:CDP-diacylglycerol--serine O-phosphatidyltransferase